MIEPMPLGPAGTSRLRRATREAISSKPARHAFAAGGAPAPARAMALTGG